MTVFYCNYFSCRNSRCRGGGDRELRPALWPRARARSAELSPAPARPHLGGDVPTPTTPCGCPHVAAFGDTLHVAAFGDKPPSPHPWTQSWRGKVWGPEWRVLGHRGFALSGWDTPLYGRGPQCTPQSAQNPHPRRQNPPVSPSTSCGFAPTEDRAPGAPPDPMAGLGGIGSSRIAAAEPGGPHCTPVPRGEGKAGGRSCPDTRAGERRGRPEQACRRRFIGDAQRLWQHQPPPRDGGDAWTPHRPGSAPHLLSARLQPSRTGLWGWHMLGWADPPKC